MEETWRDWRGAKEERIIVVDNFINLIREENFPEMNYKNFSTVFIEALTRNLVQNEVVDMITFILEEEEK